MRPSSVGGGRILRCTLSVCPSVPCLFTLEPSYERTSKIVKLPFSIIGQRQPCGRAVSFVLFTCAGRIKYGDQPHKLVGFTLYSCHNKSRFINIINKYQSYRKCSETWRNHKGFNFLASEYHCYILHILNYVSQILFTRMPCRRIVTPSRQDDAKTESASQRSTLQCTTT